MVAVDGLASGVAICAATLPSPNHRPHQTRTTHRRPRRREREMEAAAVAGVQLGSSKPQIATQAEMAEARLPLPYRNQCAHLLIPLNKCRISEFYLPWKCEPERHEYEKCQYELVMERMLQMQKIREAAKAKGGATIGAPLIPSTAKLA